MTPNQYSPPEEVAAADPGAGAPPPAEGFGIQGEDPDRAEETDAPDEPTTALAPDPADVQTVFRTPDPGDVHRPGA